MDSISQKYFDLLYRLIISGRRIALSAKRNDSLDEVDKIIEILEVAHNIPFYLKNKRLDLLEDWLKNFDLHELTS